MVELAGECRRLGTELFRAGGVSIDTREAEGEAVLARTVVQPDGDLVCFATARYCEDPEIRVAHRAGVAAWFQQAERTIIQAAGALAATSMALGLAIGVLLGGVSGVVASGVRGVAVGVAVALGASAALSMLLHAGLRRLAGIALGR